MKRLLSVAYTVTIVALASGSALCILTDIGSPIRPAVTSTFLLICPGLACTRLLRIQPAMVEATVAVAISLAIDALIAECMVYARLWSPATALWLLIAFTMVAEAARQVSAGRKPRRIRRRSAAHNEPA
jgi:hypothetical protein